MSEKDVATSESAARVEAARQDVDANLVDPTAGEASAATAESTAPDPRTESSDPRTADDPALPYAPEVDGSAASAATIFAEALKNGAFGLSSENAAGLAVQEPAVWDPAKLTVSFSNIPHRQWMYSTILVRGEITLVVAPGGAGKTALSLGMAAEVASGKSKLDGKLWAHSDQKVLYLNGEDSSAEIRRRLAAFGQQHQLTEQDLGRLFVAAADDPRIQSLYFLRTGDRNPVVNDAAFETLEAALKSLRPDLLALDPLVVFCGGGNMNDNAVMSLVMRRLKKLAVKYNCAILIVHHTRKGSGNYDRNGDAESISGAAAIVNLARRAVMPVTMTDAEAKEFGVLPSERRQYLKLVDAKSNLAPLSPEAPWYRLVTEELANAEPPVYPHGDRVQVVTRVQLSRTRSTGAADPTQRTIRFELLKLIERGRIVDGEQVAYSPNSTGKNKLRAILDDAMEVVRASTPDRQWLPKDLRATVERELENLKHEGWAVVEGIKQGRFRRSQGLRTVWERTPWAQERKSLDEHGGPTIRTDLEQEELDRADRQDAYDALERDAASGATLAPDTGGQLVNDVVND